MVKGLGDRWALPHTESGMIVGPRAVAQLGSALDWGSRGRGFKSRQPDQQKPLHRKGFCLLVRECGDC